MISDLLLSDGSEYQTDVSETDDDSTSSKSTTKSRYNYLKQVAKWDVYKKVTSTHAQYK